MNEKLLFPPIDISSFNEANVRAEIIDRLLDYFGYRSGTENNIERELTLRYPRISLGRRKPTDPELKGRADFVVEVRGVGRWTIEAKKASEAIEAEGIEQAYTYAVHPSVQATFYVLCNGLRFCAFRTLSGPDALPVLDIEYSQLNEKLHVISNLLSPDGFKRAKYSDVIDTGQPLAAGLGSRAKVVGGFIRYESFRASVPVPEFTSRMFDGYTVQISSGSIARDADRKIVATIKTSHFHQMINVMAEQLGFTEVNYFSADKIVSSDPQRPTIFEGNFLLNFKRDQMLFDVSSMQQKYMPAPGRMTMLSTAIGALDEKRFHGRFFGQAAWRFDTGAALSKSVGLEVAGIFSIDLD